MADPVMKEAGKRFIYAMNCDSQENFQEAYKHYLYTTTFISSEILKRSSNEVWCNEKTEKLLGLALNCIEAAKKINGKQLEQSAAPPEPSIVHPQISDISPVTVANPNSPDVPPQADTSEPDDEGEGAADLLSILDSLPDIPANKPGKKYQEPLKRSQTLPALRKQSDHNEPGSPGSAINPGPGPSVSGGPAARTSHTLPPHFLNPHLPPNYFNRLQQTKSLYSPSPAGHQSPNFSAPLGTVLTVSPLEQARQKNLELAAYYERRAQQGRVNPRWRLDLARTQEENLNIAREQEKILAKKLEQRKQRLEQERLEQDAQADETTNETVGAFEAILYLNSNKAHIKKFIASVREYDTQHCPSADPSNEHNIEKTFSWCFGDKSHPISEAVGNAQYNFYHRIVPLNKKALANEVKESLYDGIQTEVDAMTNDMSDFLHNLTVIIYKLYPIFDSEEGRLMLPSRLSDLFYRPFLSLLLDTYNFLNAEELTVFAKYLAQHGQDDITNFPNIKKKYHLGENPYQQAIDTLRAITETSSPLTKFQLLTSSTDEVPSCVRDFYLKSGKTEEEATELSCIGADDLVPIYIYIMTRAGKPQLLAELKFLHDVTLEDDLKGKEGYCLATAQSTFANIISRERAKQTPNGGL